MPKGKLLVCPTCGSTFELPDRAPNANVCPQCRASAGGHQPSADSFGGSNKIVCRFSRLTGQWVAHFDRAPHWAYSSDVPMRAIRRLLEGAEAWPGTFALACDADQAASSVLHRELIWKPPEILFECSACGGSGQYVGLAIVEVCQACGGRKFVSA
jgi:hypothetical protein